MIAGFLVAIAAAGCYEAAYVLQALAARREEGGEHLQATLIVRLARRPMWLIATALSGIGALLQVFALTLAPLTLVQPTLALGLVGLLALARTVLGEPVGVRDRFGVGCIVIGVAVIALIGPKGDKGGNPGGAGVAALLVVLAAVTVAPYVLRRLASPRLRVYAAAAGDAAAAIALKLLADALGAARWVAAVAWGAGAAPAGVLALNAEMSALQRLPATQVAPLVLAAQVVIPVAAAPVLLGEGWGSTPLARVSLGLAVALVGAGAALLGSSGPLGDVLALARGARPEEIKNDGGGGRPLPE